MLACLCPAHCFCRCFLLAAHASLLSAAADAKTSLPMGAQAHALYDLLSKSGLGGKDFSIIYDYLAKNKIIA